MGHPQEPESRDSMETTHDQIRKCLTKAIRKTSMRPLYLTHSGANVLSLANEVTHHVCHAHIVKCVKGKDNISFALYRYFTPSP